MAKETALVTGASRGIGRATALRLAAAYDIIAVARSANELASLKKEIEIGGGVCRTITLDIADEKAVGTALRGLEVDVLVNNAGVATMKPFIELTSAEWHRMVDVNFNSLYYVTHALIGGMVQRKRGFVVTIGSLAGRNTFVGGTCYAATKHAVNGFSESLMLEVRDANVRVAVVMPGSVATDLTPGSGDQSWKLTSNQIADSVWYVVTQPDSVLVSRIEIRPARAKGSPR
ncbi:MAG: short-chain dehydrogenase/reductase [Gemmatimonadetes bacterium]|jgi:NADP-dependent 3-hydroxy acid dehydrogenase YdfG|nr:short-chain dehydrogenase/reductase [Gemmatimonadota bacterium]